MKIKIEGNESSAELEFPCLMIADDGDILLATAIDLHSVNLKGTIICSKSITSLLGDFRFDWCPSKFRKFTGKITLEND